MRNTKINIKTIIILVLIGIIIAFFIINLNNKNSIEQQLTQKEQLEETTLDNAYIEAQLHFKELKDEQEKLLSFKSTIANVITDMGVKTSEDADASTMASNIRKISSSSGNRKVIGSTNSLSSISFDVKSILPDNYMNLTVDNFGLIDVIAQWKGGKNHYQNYILDSYDCSTGTLYCNASCSYGGEFTIYFDYTVVCFY